MAPLRFSIAGLMGFVLVAAVGLAAVEDRSASWAGGMLLLTCGTLAVGVVGAVAGRGARRIWWLGFSVFGWGYLVLSACESNDGAFTLPTTRVLEILGERVGSLVNARPNPFCGFVPGDGRGPCLAQIGHCLWSLGAAWLGGTLAASLFAGRVEGVRPEADGDGWRPSRWVAPTVAGLPGLILLVAIATIVTGDSFWAAVALGLTCAFGGLAILGAILGRGRGRAAWLGAALFCTVYTALIFSRPIEEWPWSARSMTPILEGLRSRLAPIAKGLFPPAARIQRALDRPIPMPFPDETPLSVVLAHIREETSSPAGPGIPIYVDPIGLQEAERTMDSTVRIDLEGVPLRTTLELCLKQVGLVYEVRSRYLRITSADEEAGPAEADLDDPVLIAAHCLLAVVAAGLGAALAPIVAGAGAQKPS